MKRPILILSALLVITALGGYALADDPNGRLGQARTLLAQVDALLAAEIAAPGGTVTRTVTVTAGAPPPTTAPSTPTTAPPPAGFPSRAQALARSSVVVVSGTRSDQYRVGSPPPDTTYDFRGLTSTAFPANPNPLSLGRDSAARGTVAIGGRVIGQQPRDQSWEQVHNVGGAALTLAATGFQVSYDLYAENTNDGVEMRRVDLSTSYLVDGLRCVWIRDDCIEADDEMSGTINNVRADGVNNAISLGQSVSNANAVTNISNAVFVHAPMVNARAADGIGHQTLFKQAPAGLVNMTNVRDCLFENPISPGRIGIRPRGTWSNVVFVLGPGWVGSNPSVPNGASVSRDWAGLCSLGG